MGWSAEFGAAVGGLGREAASGSCVVCDVDVAAVAVCPSAGPGEAFRMEGEEEEERGDDAGRSSSVGGKNSLEEEEKDW
jgi:hypothetical protein